MCPPILFPEKLQLYGFIGTACASRTELIGQRDSYSLSCPLSITKDHAVWKNQQEDLQGLITHSPANACPRNKPRLQAFYSSWLMKHQFRIIIRLLTLGHSTFDLLNPFSWRLFPHCKSVGFRRRFMILTVNLSGFLHPGHPEPWARLPRLHQVPLPISQTLTLLLQVSMPWEFCALSWQLARRLSDSTRSSILSRPMDGKTVGSTICVMEQLY